MLSERDRRTLYEAARSTWGDEPAEVLMSFAPPTEFRAEVALLRGEMAGMRADIRSEVALLDGKIAGVQREIAGLDGKIAGLRSELKGEIASMLPKLIAANLASIVASVSLVVASAKLL